MKTQEVDLSKIKAGDTVHFRCGGKEVVTSIKKSMEPPHKNIFFYFLGFYKREDWRYNSQGRMFLSLYEETPFDIIRVEPAFRWEDVKPGMAFRHEGRGTLYWYVGPFYADPEQFVVVGGLRSGGNYQSIFKEYLTPAPEHNIEVAK